MINTRISTLSLKIFIEKNTINPFCHFNVFNNKISFLHQHVSSRTQNNVNKNKTDFFFDCLLLLTAQVMIVRRMMGIFLFISMICHVIPEETLLDKVRVELERSKMVDKDPIIPFLCRILPSKEFIKEADDEDLFSSILYELGFGVLGVRTDSWAAKYQTNPRKPPSCFSALYSAATADVTKSTLAISRRIIARCCHSNEEF